jgi:transposase-like protein
MHRNIPDEVVSPMDFGVRFPDEEAARKYIEERRNKGKPPVCPVCGSPAHEWRRPRPKHRRRPDLPDYYPGYYKCGSRKCRKGFTVKDNSIFSYSHIPLHRWLHAIYCLLTEIKGKSSRQLARRWARVCQKSGWHLGHRIREVMSRYKENLSLGGDTEADESYFYEKRKNKHLSKRRNRSKSIGVMGIVERNGGKVVFQVLPDAANIKKGKLRIEPDTSKEMLMGILCKYVEEGSTVFTDGNPSYNDLDSLGYNHYSVVHSDKIYVIGGYIHTNGIESVWRLPKDASRAVYYRTSHEHLQRYLDEIAYRWNEKTAEISVMDALDAFVDMCWGVSLPWKKLTADPIDLLTARVEACKKACALAPELPRIRPRY